MAGEPQEAGSDRAPADRWLRGLACVAGAVLASALILVIVQIGRVNERRQAAVAAERHSYDVILLTASISGAIGRAEAALGRYVIDPKAPRQGSIYYAEWVAAGRQIDRLERAVADNGAQRAEAARLRTLFEVRGHELAAPAGHAFYRKYLPALSTYYQAGKQPTIAAIARSLGRIEATERSLLAARARATAQVAARADWLVAMLSLFGIAVVLLAGALGWMTFVVLRQHARARAEADEESDRAGWLEVAVADRTAELSAANARLQREMAEREAAELQLRQVQKMEAVGQLTGGIAHDFNNMLAVVLGGLELARRRVRLEADDLTRHLDNAMEGANRAATLTRRLLSFARAEPLLPQAVDPGELIAGMSDLMDRTLGERIGVTVRGLDGLWPVWVDGHQLENAILNLAVNARDAMDGHGRLLVSAANVTLDAGEVGEAAAGDYVCIAVVDDGCGMPREVLDRAFEPFFTTKEVGKGTGLGLSQIFGFVRQSGGEIAVDSVVGRGTAVSLYLPRHIAEAQAGAAVTELKPALPEPAPLLRPVVVEAVPAILVVEDDPRVRRATMDGLEELGLPAICTDNGGEALDILARTPSIRLLVTDVVMPGMTGPELAKRAARLYPALGILFVTGYVGEADGGGELAGQAILRKPFTLNALERAILAALPPEISGSNPGGSVAAAM